MNAVRTRDRESIPVGAVPRTNRSVQVLAYTVFALIVVLLLGVMYVVVEGLLSPSGPRTALEAKLLVSSDAIRSQPTLGEPRYDHIVALSAVGQTGDALSEAQRSKKELKGLELPWAYLAEAKVYFDSEQYTQVVKTVGEGIKANDAAAKARVEEYSRKNIKINQSTVAKPHAIRLKMLEAQAYARLEKPKESLAALSEVLKMDPRAADVLVLRATTYVQLGQKDKARADFEQALKYVPDLESALSGLESLGSE